MRREVVLNGPGDRDRALTQAEVLFANDFELDLRSREKILLKPIFLLFLVFDVRGCRRISEALKDLLVYKIVRIMGVLLYDDRGFDIQDYTGLALGRLGLRREAVPGELYQPE